MLLTSIANKGVGGVFTQVGLGISFIGKTMTTVGRVMLLNPNILTRLFGFSVH